jgi:hypothetical protein
LVTTALLLLLASLVRPVGVDTLRLDEDMLREDTRRRVTQMGVLIDDSGGRPAREHAEIVGGVEASSNGVDPD